MVKRNDFDDQYYNDSTLMRTTTTTTMTDATQLANALLVRAVGSSQRDVVLRTAARASTSSIVDDAAAETSAQLSLSRLVNQWGSLKCGAVAPACRRCSRYRCCSYR